MIKCLLIDARPARSCLFDECLVHQMFVGDQMFVDECLLLICLLVDVCCW